MTTKTRGGGTTRRDWPKIEVKWADHWISHGDQDMEEVLENLKPVYGHYVGYLVAENKQMLAICSNEWEDGEPSEVMYIMKRCIVERKTLTSD